MTSQDPSSTTPETPQGPMYGPQKPDATSSQPETTESQIDSSGAAPPPPPPTPGTATLLDSPPATHYEQSSPGQNYNQAAKAKKPSEFLKEFRLPLSPLLFALPLLAALSLDIATHSSWASISGFLTIVFIAAGTLIGRHRTKQLTPTSITSAALAVAAGTNLVLRSSPVVASPTWLLVLVLLLAASTDLSPKTLRQQIESIATYIVNLFQLPNWLKFSLRQRFGPSTHDVSWIPLFRGLILAALVVVPVVALLASGDRVFASLIPTGIDNGVPLSHLILTTFFLPICAAFVLTATSQLASDRPNNSDTSMVTNTAKFPLELLIVLGGLTTVLTIWVALQLAVIADGDQIIARTEGLTRADYAREGFSNSLPSQRSGLRW